MDWTAVAIGVVGAIGVATTGGLGAVLVYASTRRAQSGDIRTSTAGELWLAKDNLIAQLSSSVAALQIQANESAAQANQATKQANEAQKQANEVAGRAIEIARVSSDNEARLLLLEQTNVILRGDFDACSGELTALRALIEPK